MIVFQTLRLRYLILLVLVGLLLALLWGQFRRHAGAGSTADPAAAAPAARIETDPLAQFRLARDTEHSRQREELTKLMNGAANDSTVRGEAEKELWQLTQLEAVEHEAETVLAAEGWTEAAVSLANGEATVFIHGALTKDDAAAVGDLTSNVTGLDQAAIKIVER